MLSTRKNQLLRIAVTTALMGMSALAASESGLSWQTVANNATLVPDAYEKAFNSYGQPSVAFNGTVVFRGRSTGASTGPIRGIYARAMEEPAPLRMVAKVGGPVPEPNNVSYGEMAAPFNEFPAFPRIDVASTTIVTRGQSRPVWEYGPEGEETRVGTSGVYFERNRVLGTGAAQLGAVPEFPQFQVPGATAGTRFDQFPGSPTVTNRDVIAFKGNYTDGIGYTGVFIRNVRAGGGLAPLQLVASSQVTGIPGAAAGQRFGSTAPPSAAGNYVYFVGSDNEAMPTTGGIYRASLKAPDKLEPLVTIGTDVPGEPAGTTFARFGESLSLGGKGRQVAFWASWNEHETTSTLFECPDEGNKDLKAYCELVFPDGVIIERPTHQGLFVYDAKAKQATTVAKTGEDGIEQFQFCVYSGRPPGTGTGHEGGDSGEGGEEGDEGEAPRWRCSAFAALSGVGNDWYQVAYKATRLGKDGIHLWDAGTTSTETVLEVGMEAADLDAMAPADSRITSLGIERDGFRKGWLALTASMAADAPTAPEGNDETEVEGWAGVYVTRVPGWEDPALTTILVDKTVP